MKTKLLGKKIETIEQDLVILRAELKEIASESEEEGEEKPIEESSEENDDEEAETEDEAYGSDIPEAIQKEIIPNLPQETRGAIRNWDTAAWKGYDKEDLINLLKLLYKRHSILLRSDHIEQLDIEKLILILHQFKVLKENNEDDALTREELDQYMLEGSQEMVGKWSARAAEQTGYDEAFYEKCKLIFEPSESFFAQGEDTDEDNINKIAKVADSVSEFKLSGPNPLAQFKKDIKTVVSNTSKHLADMRQMYISMRAKINSALNSDENLEKPENRELKRYYNIWLSHIGEESVKEFLPEHIDPLLADERLDYLSNIENIVKTMLDGLWESGYNSRQNEVKLNPKKQAIVRYFSEFLEASEQVIQPMREAHNDRLRKAEAKEIETESKLRAGGGAEETGEPGAPKLPAEKKTARKRGGADETQMLKWHELRLQGRMYIFILVQYYNEHQGKFSKEKSRFTKLRSKIISQFLIKGENRFDVRAVTSPQSSQQLEAFEKSLEEEHRNEILKVTEMRPDDFDLEIERLKEKTRLMKMFKEKDYKLPDFK